MKQLLTDYYAKSFIAYFASAIVDGKKYISNIRYNGIFVIDLETNKIEFVTRIPNYDDTAMGLHAYAFSIGDKIYFLPSKGKSIDVLDVKTRCTESYYIDCWQGEYDLIVSFAYVENEEIYMFPRFCKRSFIRFSTKTGRFSTVFEAANEKINQLGIFQESILTLSGQRSDDMVFLPLYLTDKVAVINTITGQLDVIEIDSQAKITTLCVEDDTLWVDNDNKLLKYDLTDKELIRVYENAFQGVEGKKNTNFIVASHEKIYLLPQWLGDIRVLDKMDGTIRSLNWIGTFGNVVPDNIRTWRDIGSIIVDDKEIVIPSLSHQNEVHICFEDDSITGILYQKEGECIPEIIQKMGFYYEGTVTLDDFLQMVISMDEGKLV